jgi:rubrerythrin
MTDLRELLREARDCIADMGNKTTPYTDNLRDRLMDALAQEPEPVAWEYKHKEAGSTTLTHQPPDRVIETDLTQYTWRPLYAAPPSDAALISEQGRKFDVEVRRIMDLEQDHIAQAVAKKDERIKELEIIVQNRGMALAKRAHVYEENKAAEAEIERLKRRLEAWNGSEEGVWQGRAEAAERRAKIEFDAAEEMGQRAKAAERALAERNWRCPDCGAMTIDLPLPPRAEETQRIKAQALRELIDRFDEEWRGPSPIKADVSGWIWRVASEQERGDKE